MIFFQRTRYSPKFNLPRVLKNLAQLAAPEEHPLSSHKRSNMQIGHEMLLVLGGIEPPNLTLKPFK